jgi:hypothetical protein
MKKQEQPKQEKLEEAAERVAKLKYGATIYGLERVNAFTEGAKWQAERMYSDEELKYAIEVSVAKALGVMNFTINKESFKQFKKK